jgi:hypothetical protein
VTDATQNPFPQVNGNVAGTGFEPVKAMPAILQTAPFGRSGTLPDEAG